MTTPLEQLLVAQIASQGPMRFDRFMELCLYHPRHGYYSKPGRIGRGGHYLTSPELDPAFALLWRRAFERVWDALGRPQRFELVEIGPGEGSFAHALLSAPEDAFSTALRLVLVERFPAVREAQQARLEGAANVTWSETIPPVEAGCVFGNEVLDNQPVRVLQGDEELYVDLREGSLRETWLPHEETMEVTEPDRSTELSQGAIDLITAAAGALQRGALFFVDYGHEGLPFSTLASYGSEGADTQVLANPGERDITAHVDMARAASALRASGWSVSPLMTQGDALWALGSGEQDKELRKSYALGLAGGDGAGAVRALSRRGALAALVDPSGLGRLKVLQAWRGLAEPPLRT